MMLSQPQFVLLMRKFGLYDVTYEDDDMVATIDQGVALVAHGISGEIDLIMDNDVYRLTRQRSDIDDIMYVLQYKNSTPGKPNFRKRLPELQKYAREHLKKIEPES